MTIAAPIAALTIIQPMVARAAGTDDPRCGQAGDGQGRDARARPRRGWRSGSATSRLMRADGQQHGRERPREDRRACRRACRDDLTGRPGDRCATLLTEDDGVGVGRPGRGGADEDDGAGRDRVRCVEGLEAGHRDERGDRPVDERLDPLAWRSSLVAHRIGPAGGQPGLDRAAERAVSGDRVATRSGAAPPDRARARIAAPKAAASPSSCIGSTPSSHHNASTCRTPPCARGAARCAR